MKEIKTEELAAATKLENNIYHSSGTLFMKKGETIGEKHIAALKESGIEVLFEQETKESRDDIIKTLTTRTIPVNDLNVGEEIQKPFYDSSNTLLLEAGVTITQGFKDGLKRRGISNIFMKKDPSALKRDEYEQYVAILSGEKKSDEQPLQPVETILDDDQLIDPASISIDKIDSIAQKGGGLSVKPSGEPIESKLREHDETKQRDEKQKQGFKEAYEKNRNLSTELYNILKSDSTGLDGNLVGDLSRQVIGSMISDRNLMLNSINLKASGKDFVLDHVLSVTMLSVNLGASMGLGEKQILELAYSAFLHNVGMLKVPEEILLKKNKLMDREFLEIQKHSIVSIDILQKVRGVPKATPFVAYQTHERINGSGYPKKRSSVTIHDFSKIIAVCDVFLAISSDRPYRSAKLPYTAMETVLKMGGRKLLDTRIIKALLKYTSLFPVGSWVQLSNGFSAKVVSANTDNYMKPIVSVMAEGDKAVSDPYRLDLLKEEEVKVVKAIEPIASSQDTMEGF